MDDAVESEKAAEAERAHLPRPSLPRASPTDQRRRPAVAQARGGPDGGGGCGVRDHEAAEAQDVSPDGVGGAGCPGGGERAVSAPSAETPRAFLASARRQLTGAPPHLPCEGSRRPSPTSRRSSASWQPCRPNTGRQRTSWPKPRPSASPPSPFLRALATTFMRMLLTLWLPLPSLGRIEQFKDFLREAADRRREGAQDDECVRRSRSLAAHALQSTDTLTASDHV